MLSQVLIYVQIRTRAKSKIIHMRMCMHVHTRTHTLTQVLKCDMAKSGFAACAVITQDRTFLVRPASDTNEKCTHSLNPSYTDARTHVMIIQHGHTHIQVFIITPHTWHQVRSTRSVDYVSEFASTVARVCSQGPAFGGKVSTRYDEDNKFAVRHETVTRRWCKPHTSHTTGL